MIESEKLLERKLNSHVRAAGGVSIKLLASHLTGLPDRLILLPGGYICFAEVKTTGEKPKKIQIFWQNKLKNLGFKTYVVDNTGQIKQIIKDYEKGYVRSIGKPPGNKRG